MSIVIEKLDNKNTILNVSKDDVTYVLLADQPGEKKVTIELAKEGIEAKILGIFVGCQGEMKVKTIQRHIKPHATSQLHFKSVLLGGARFDYQGLIKIEPAAQGSNAYQRNDNLLLSQQAQVETQPDLEIEANEVRCTHGATTGQLDEEQVYYLMSRGLDRLAAEQVLIRGFLEEIVDKIDDIPTREKVLQFVQTNLKFEGQPN